MISSTSSYIAQQYQNVAATLKPGQKTDQKDEKSRPVPPVQAPQDNVEVSEEGRNLSRNSRNTQPQAKEPELPGQPEELSHNEQSTLTKLQTRDKQVRAHEQAHLAAAGQYARGGASFVYQSGPDGKVYAVGGEVSIDIGIESSPEATISKMQTVRRAALAPAQPSSTDRQVAAQATARLNQAQQQVQNERMDEIQANIDSDSSVEGNDAPTDNNSDISASQANSDTRTLMAETYRAVNEYL